MPEAGRSDYQELIRFRQLAPGEPYFFIRGRDAVSGDAVRAWCALAYAAGAPRALIESALRQADAIDAWPDKHVPDADHLNRAEAQQLDYEFGRRAWEARTDCADPKVMLAEERAIADALGRVRPLLAQLFQHGEEVDGAFVFRPPVDELGRPTCDPLGGLRRLETILRGR
jgi:hypothetical protein